MTDEGTAGLSVGARVRVRRDPTFAGPWPAEPLATVVAWPRKLGEIDPSIDGGELFRIVEHHSGPERYWGPQRVYFVEFDEPQFDTDGPEGGGPYGSASVWERYLEPLSSS
jgi:hypothetical protein